MHRFMPCAPSEIDDLEIAMLDLLVHASGASIAPLADPALSALIEARGLLGEHAPPSGVYRHAARLLRERAVAGGADAERYRSAGWRTLGL